MGTFNIKQGDASPAWQTVLQDNAGNAVDLSGATVALSMIRVGSRTKTIDARAATITDAPTGAVQFLFDAADTAVWGSYLVEWIVTYSGGRVEKFPNDRYDLVYVERAA